MLLNDTQVEAIQAQTGAVPIPSDNPANDALKNVFGDHTFYADELGLHVLEPAVTDEGANSETDAEVIQIAEWANDDKSEIQPIQPRRSGAIFKLEAVAEGK